MRGQTISVGNSLVDRHIADSGRRFGAENNRETEATSARFPVTHNSIHYLIHDFTALLFEILQTLRNYNWCLAICVTEKKKLLREIAHFFFLTLFTCKLKHSTVHFSLWFRNNCVLLKFLARIMLYLNVQTNTKLFVNKSNIYLLINWERRYLYNAV